jgi:hypothetical protein
MTKNTKIPAQLSTALDSHFLTCSAVVTGAVVILPMPAASGGIIFSGLQNLPIFSLDVNGGAYFDVEPPFGTSQGPTQVNGWELNPYNFGASIYMTATTKIVLSGNVASNLPANTLIDGSLNFSTLTPRGTGFYGGVEIPQGSTGYVGFQFDPDGIAGAQTFYGWAQMKVGGGASGNGNVISWAYDDTGAPIQAGAVPEPGSLALLALGAAGVASWRRRPAA